MDITKEWLDKCEKELAEWQSSRPDYSAINWPFQPTIESSDKLKELIGFARQSLSKPTFPEEVSTTDLPKEIESLTPEQAVAFYLRLDLERQHVELQRRLGNVKFGGCNHIIIKGRILYSPRQSKVVWTHADVKKGAWNDECCSAYCAICDKEFGWWCPKSSTHYCEYDGHTDDCKWCHQPDERK